MKFDRREMAKKIFPLTDLTSLKETDTSETVTALCKKAVTEHDHVAAVCVYPAFVMLAKQCLSNTPVKIATVANFPHGTDPIDLTQQAIQHSIEAGADEIDVVFPYRDFLKGHIQEAKEFIQACKNVCGNKILLKVILETGAMGESDLIAKAARESLLAGADFIKTSTGKITPGATLEAASTMLSVIAELTPILKRPLGLKVSGGVRTVEQATAYIALAESIMGENWVTPAIFRIGASQLID